jgi:predicted dehydrogenase
VVNVSLSYESGSIGTISYLANGDKSLSKERVEIYGHGCTAVIDDFKSLTVYAGGRKKEKKLFSQDKGQKAEVRTFLDAILQGKPSPIPFEELYSASKVAFGILESIRTGQAIRI